MDMFSSLPQSALPHRLQSSHPGGKAVERKNQADSRADAAEGMSFQGILENRKETQTHPGSHHDGAQADGANRNDEAQIKTESPAMASGENDSKGNEGIKAVLTAAVQGVPSKAVSEAGSEVLGLKGETSEKGHPLMIDQMIKSMLGLGNTSNAGETAYTGEMAATLKNTNLQAELSAQTTADVPSEKTQPGQGQTKIAVELPLASGKNDQAVSEKPAPTPAPAQLNTETKPMSVLKEGMEAALAKGSEGVKDQEAKPVPNQAKPQLQQSQSQPETPAAGQVKPAAIKIPLDTLTQPVEAKEAPAAQMGISKPEPVMDTMAPNPVEAEVPQENAANNPVPDQVSMSVEEQQVVQASGASPSTSDQSGQESLAQQGPLPQIKQTTNVSPGTRVSSSPQASTELAAKAQKIRGQVIRELSSQMDGRIGQEKITLTLNPEKLGQVEIQFLAKDNELNVVITASNSEAEQVLREGVKELSEGIADKSGRWNQVDIKVDQRGQDQDKNDNKQDTKRDSHKKEEQNKQQQNQNKNQAQAEAPDWASLVSEG